MCGRFTLRLSGEEIAEEFDLPTASMPEVPARYNIAPTDPVALVRTPGDGGGRELASARWGLIPHWVDDPGDFPTLINARSETAPEKPSFRDAFRRRRCLVPADGFYEWMKTNGSKQPWYVHFEEDRVFGLAGLWERWEDPEGEELVSCTILTTEPNDTVARLHDRMPVILPRERYDDWLVPGRYGGDLRDLLVPHPTEGMAAHPVSRAVNDPTHDTPDCIQPLEP